MTFSQTCQDRAHSCTKNSGACLALHLQFLFSNAAISLCRVNVSREMRKDTVCWTVCAVHAFKLFILYNWTLQCQNYRHMHLWGFVVSRWLLANVLPWNCVTLSECLDSVPDIWFIIYQTRDCIESQHLSIPLLWRKKKKITIQLLLFWRISPWCLTRRPLSLIKLLCKKRGNIYHRLKSSQLHFPAD